MSLNLNSIKTPGVYIDEVSLLPPGVAPVETAVPAFIGYTEKNPTGDFNPFKISSFLEYLDKFGGPPNPSTLGLAVQIVDTVVDNYDSSSNYVDSKLLSRSITANSAVKPVNNMYFAVQHYFANGGGDCYIVSVGGYGNGTIASNSDLISGVNALENEDEPTLFVIPESINLTAGNYGAYEAALDQAGKLKDRFVIIDVIQTDHSQSTNSPAQDISNFQAPALNTDFGLYGAAYYPYLETTVDIVTGGFESSVNITHRIQLEDGSASEATPMGTVTGTPPVGALTLADISEDLLKKQIIGIVQNTSVILPPSPAVAGIYAKVDNSRGVWKAPANVSVGAIVGPSVKINDNIQDKMNIDPNGGKSVNAIRFITGRGTVIWGARTLAGNDNEWRYVPVRRFFNFVEESVKKATYRFVFEPNDANTWVKIRGMIENFLTLQWSLGALQGSKPEQAFFVRVGLGQTMTADDILNGRLIVEIGMAAVRPAEFIILRFMHKLPEA